MVKQRGFTIVELIMVIVILGIISAVAAPRFFDRKVFDERFYFEEALSTIRYAQKLAVASGCRIQVSWDSMAGKVILHRADNCDVLDPQYSGEIVGLDGQSYSGNSKSEDSNEGASNPATTGFPFVFSPLGCIYDKDSHSCATDTEATRFKVQVSNQFIFQVHAATGFVEVAP
ncbi:pilus assembly FimT family protein [Stutzerimonas frequens]|uniref:pilus assembly FimT family protein n=1 Tax=Stutzerimonas frequens TaxID=2968969 RepID=UPI001AAE7FD6|nr:type II secretion system protein [Stutzerimonas frequens]QTF55827.1 type II secretion system protein [Stutzerimonas frequens]